MIIDILETSEKRKIRAAINLFGIQDEDSDFVESMEICRVLPDGSDDDFKLVDLYGNDVRYSPMTDDFEVTDDTNKVYAVDECELTGSCVLVLHLYDRKLLKAYKDKRDEIVAIQTANDLAKYLKEVEDTPLYQSAIVHALKDMGSSSSGRLQMKDLKSWKK